VALDGPRGASADELPAVLELVDSVFRGGMGALFPTLFHPANAEWLRCFWDGRSAVAHAGIWHGRIRSRGRRLAVAHLGAVCTRPEYRGQGLAGALLAEALPRLRAAGVGLLLISGDRSLYRRIGARPFGRLLRYRVGLDEARRWADAALAVEAPGPSAAEEFAPLQALEAVRYERTAQEWRLLLPGRGYVPPGQGGSAFAVRRPGGELAAYLLLGGARRRGPARLSVHEFAGERAAVLAALPAALAAAGAEAAELLVQPADGPLRALLEAAGLVAAAEPQQGTARVLDYRACARAFGLHPPGQPPPLGSPAEAEFAAAWTTDFAQAHELPRNDGLNYI